MMNIINSKIIGLLLVFLFIGKYSYGTEYQIIDLGYGGPVFDINDSGQMTDPGGATGINASGQIVGSYGTASGYTHAFIYENNMMTDIGTLGGNYSYAHGINDGGQIVGYSQTSSGNMHAFLYENNSMQDLGPYFGLGTGCGRTEAQGINNSGQIVGTLGCGDQDRAFIYENGQYADLETRDDVFNTNVGSHAYSINDNSQIVGYIYRSLYADRAFLYENGSMQDLGILGGIYTKSRAFGINNLGQVVGYSSDGVNDYKAFVYDNGQMNALVDLGGSYSSAYGINNNGQIVGISLAADGSSHAVLWNPVSVVPEPISSTLFIVGGILLGIRNYLRRKTGHNKTVP